MNSNEAGSTSEADLRTLSQQAVFRGCRPEMLLRVAQQSVWRRYQPEALVIDFDDASRDVFLVLEGALRVLVRRQSGREVVLGDLAAGHIFGELTAIDGQHRSASVTALTRCRLCRIPDRLFAELLGAEPDFRDQVLRYLVARVRELTERLVERDVLPVRLRLCAELLRLSRPRDSSGAARVVSPPPPQQILAARIGATREAVSRELSILERCQLIQKLRSSILLPDPATIRGLIDSVEHPDGWRGDQGRARPAGTT